MRESTGGHCRRTAQELCVIRRSMKTLRVRCRWVPREPMVVDASRKRHGNSITMLRLLRDGVLSIVDEDQELANRKTHREKHKSNLRPHLQVGSAQTVEWDRRNAVRCSHAIKADETSCCDSSGEFVCLTRPDARQHSFLGHVVPLGPSSSSEEHHCSYSCLGTGMRVGKPKHLCHYRSSLVHLHPR